MVRRPWYVGEVLLLTQGEHRSLTLSMLGECIPQPRMRVRRLGPGFVLYDPSGPARNWWKEAARRALAEIGIDELPVFPNLPGMTVKITVTFHINKVRKHLDNLLEFIMDAMHGVLYKDDNCICDCIASKKHTTGQENCQIIVENH